MAFALALVCLSRISSAADKPAPAASAKPSLAAAAPKPSPAATKEQATPIKDFTLPSASDGSLIHLSDYSGKVVLINYWRTECAYSRDEAPKLVDLYKKYHDKGLEIFGVSDDHPNTIKDIPAHIAKYGITWRIGLNDLGDFRREVFKHPGTPSNYLVTRDGKMIDLGKDWDEKISKIEGPIVKALADPAPKEAAITPRTLEAAPPFDLADIGTKNVRSTDLAGKPMVVAFFDAHTCDRAGKELSSLHDQYGARGLQVIGIDLFDQSAAMKGCVDKYKMHFPVLRGTKEVQQAWLGADRLWGVFFINRDGKIVKEITHWEDDDLSHFTWPKYADYLLSPVQNKANTLSVSPPTTSSAS